MTQNEQKAALKLGLKWARKDVPWGIGKRDNLAIATTAKAVRQHAEIPKGIGLPVRQKCV